MMKNFLYLLFCCFALCISTAANAQVCTPNVNACFPNNPSYPFCFTPAAGATGYVGVPYNETIFVNVKSQFTVQGFTVYIRRLVITEVLDAPPGLNFKFTSGNPNDANLVLGPDTVGILNLPDTTTAAAQIGIFGCASVYGTPTQANIGPGTADNDTVRLVVHVFISFTPNGDPVDPNTLGQNINPLELYYEVPVKVGLSVAASNDVSITCGDQTQLTASTNEANVTYSWSPATGLDNPNVANPNASPTQTTVYTVTITNPNGEKGADSVKVTVDQSGLVKPTAAPVERCGPGTIQLTASGGSNYNWYNAANGGSPIGTGGVLNVANITTTTDYYVSNSPGGVCESERVKVTATVKPLPKPDFSIGGTADYRVNKPVMFTNNSIDAASLMWDFGDGGTSTEPDPSHTYSATGDYIIKLEATHANGCKATFADTITVLEAQSAADLLESAAVKLYPNPTNGRFTLTLNETLNANVAIFNVLGEKVWSNAFSASREMVVDPGVLPNGLYLVKISTPKGVALKQVVVNR